MPDHKIQRALIAVYDKAGIAEFARALVDEFGIEIISTGGTAAHLKAVGVPVTMVEEVTGFPELLDGRVKTLHPNIHAAILADRDNPDHMRQLAEHSIKPIDMVVVNLYPFEKTVADPNCKFEDAIEMIDIGGPCLLRAAAKNHRHVAAVYTPTLYETVISHMPSVGGAVSSGYKRQWASSVFDIISGYDRRVSDYLEQGCRYGAALPQQLYLCLKQSHGIRYGENPHQVAGKYFVKCTQDSSTQISERYPDDIERSMSFNNYVDSDAALALCSELTRPAGRDSKACVVFIKHTNACGVGLAGDPVDAYRQAYLGDPNAAMGGILAVNFPVTADFADAVMDSLARWGKDAGAGAFFVEVWVAPSFDGDAEEIIRTKKKWGANVRLLDVGPMDVEPDSTERDYKRISGGMLVQTRDVVGLNEDDWKVVTKRAPTDSEWADLRLAWLIAKHTKSNAISICQSGMLIGNGAGQMSRVMSCRIATWLAKENGHADSLVGSAAASDAFFPFRDGPDILMDAGVTALIQPGGSKRDEEVIAACNERGAAMVFTGTRHFKH